MAWFQKNKEFAQTLGPNRDGQSSSLSTFHLFYFALTRINFRQSTAMKSSISANSQQSFREEISPMFFRPKFFHGCPYQNAWNSGVWRAWPKFVARCPQDIRPQTSSFGLLFRFWSSDKAAQEYTRQSLERRRGDPKVKISVCKQLRAEHINLAQGLRMSLLQVHQFLIPQPVTRPTLTALD